MKQKPAADVSAVERIYQEYESFSEANRHLADFFLNNLEMATFKSVSELKNLTGVSDATIIRFAYELGYASFKEFREHLADYIRKIIYSRLPDARKSEEGDASIDQVVKADINYIQRTMEAVDPGRFALLVDKVCEAGTVWIMGARISSFVADLLAFQLGRLGYNARAILRDRRPLLEQALDIAPGDLLIVFDQIIYSPDVYDAVEFVARNQSQVPIVTLTSDPLARIVQHAELSFFLDLSGQKDFSLISLSAPMCFVNALIESVFARNPKKAREKLERFEEHVLTRPGYSMSMAAKRQRRAPARKRTKKNDDSA